MKNSIFNGIILFLFLASPVYAQNYQKTELGVKTNLQSMDVEVQFYSSKIVRVVKSPEGKSFRKESLSVLKAPEKINPDIQQTGNRVTLKSKDLAVELDLKTGRVSFFDTAGKSLLTEKDYGTEFSDYNDAGNSTFSVRQAFLLDKEEAIYGLGQQQKGKMNQRNQTLHMEQVNTIIYIPFFQSVKGYGVFWDNYSPTDFSDNKQGLSFSSEVADCSDYYFMYGHTMDGVVACMRDLTGDAPLFPLWTWGYWQSKERYASQDELVGAVQKYRDLKVPLDGIIQDWRYWSEDDNYWNGMNFGNPKFPEPQKMMNDIHKLNAHAIISIWPSFGQRTAPFKEFKEKGLLLDFRTFPSDSARFYNAYNKEARDIYWKYMDNNLFSIGMDGWWMDATEIEASRSRREVLDIQTSLGTFRKMRNVYPLMTTGGVYTNQREKTSDKRVFILTRSAFAGQQRNSAIAWSGDVDGKWQVLREQITAGLNFSACAIPYWNTDIGGFWVREGGSSRYADYRELYVRWLQFGAFSPMMRSHGANTPREIWQFGQKGDWAYDAIEKFIRLRYRLLPYNYALSWDVTSHAGSIIRMLSMDFPEDTKVHDLGNQYMYGKSFLVAPVLEAFYSSGVKENAVVDFSKTQTYPVYLPKGAGWYDFWTGKFLKGGVEIQAETPIDIMPLYVKAGSIIPLGPDVQYAGEKSWENLEIRVYPGADAEFTLYEDEKDNYNYESGAYTTIPFTYNENEQSLTIGNRQGNYPGMLTNRTFKIIQVKKGYGMGDLLSIAHDTIVTYSGSEVKIYFDAEKETNYSYYEAEEATLSENLSIHNTNPGFNGTGYVSALEEGNESSITFNVKVKEAGSYLVKLRSAIK
ncbi:xylosidase [Bacteroidia bacterium]|nr:xylosidase [Bacteroidia bacterium]